LKSYDKDGSLSKEETYVNGVLGGSATVYYGSGMIKKQMAYKNAVLDGTAVEYDETGRPKAQETYVKGVLTNRLAYDATADLSSKPAVPDVKVKAETKKPLPPPAETKK
jgi:antitoxin component YwqK of YwqJK toxin-antitoxin module